jgi:endoglucanase
VRPTSSTGAPEADAFLWIKPPGESDGTCNGGPGAGQFWVDYALALAGPR